MLPAQSGGDCVKSKGPPLPYACVSLVKQHSHQILVIQVPRMAKAASLVVSATTSCMKDHNLPLPNALR